MRGRATITAVIAIGAVHVFATVGLCRTGAGDVVRFLLPTVIAAIGNTAVLRGFVTRRPVELLVTGTAISAGSFGVGMLICLNRFGS